MPQSENPFHAGETDAQTRAGVSGVAEWAGGFIRDAMPDQHRDFFAQLPFVVIAGADQSGQHWVTLIEGDAGFIRSPDAGRLDLATAIDPSDPLHDAIGAGTEVGMLGIELASRRRNRLSGVMGASEDGFSISVRQSFGNCPQYIHERAWRRVERAHKGAATSAGGLSEAQMARVRSADTLFIGSGQKGSSKQPSDGFDASHRGGEPGFVDVVDATHLRIPDYAGNNFFNTIGNLLQNPAVGLVFVDFETGGLLHLSGRATVKWDPDHSSDPGALRMIDVEIEHVIDRPAALSLRWSKDAVPQQDLRIVDKVVESATVTSFYLASTDEKPLLPFQAGQHLPVELDVPGQSGKTRRSYSLSGAADGATYRISVKREGHGSASRFLHDTAQPGDTFAAGAPSGDFVIPCSTCPLVLVSAGVGVTPMVAMLHAISREQGDRAVYFVHGTQNGASHAIRSEVHDLIETRSNIKSLIFYSQPNTGDMFGDDFHATGRITAQSLLDLHPGPQARYMLCGPAQFLADLSLGLENAGVPDHHIHFETFGPAG